MAKKQSPSSKTIEGLHTKVLELENEVADLKGQIAQLKDAAKNSSTWDSFKKWFT